jgi:hypothetical protein
MSVDGTCDCGAGLSRAIGAAICRECEGEGCQRCLASGRPVGVCLWCGGRESAAGAALAFS